MRGVMASTELTLTSTHHREQFMHTYSLLSQHSVILGGKKKRCCRAEDLSKVGNVTEKDN